MEYEREEEERQQELEDRVIKYINRLTKQELRDELCDILFDGPEWLLERFIYEKIE